MWLHLLVISMWFVLWCTEPRTSNRKSSTRWINSMEQFPFWQATSSTASQEIPRLLWNQMLHYNFL